MTRRPLRVGEQLTDEEREAIVASIREKAKAASECFRATDPRKEYA